MENEAMCSEKQIPIEVKTEQLLWDALLKADGVSFAWNDAQASPAEAMSTVVEAPEARISYPWYISDPESESYFTDLEQEINLDEWSQDEIASRSQSFFSHLDQLWSAVSVQETLLQRFAARVPQQLIATIVQQAQNLADQSLSLADQLVQSVQDVLPGLAEDDLYVLARPFAYALRSQQPVSVVDSTLETIRSVDWEQLSDIEQARLSLAIARSVLVEMARD